MMTHEKIRKQVEEAERALAKTKDLLSERGAQINSLERDRCDLLVVNRLGGGSGDSDGQRLKKLALEIEKLRAANDDDSVVVSRLTSQLEIDRKRLVQAERESNCDAFLNGEVIGAPEIENKIFGLASDLRDALKAARDHDLAVEKEISQLGLRQIVQGLRIGGQVSLRRGEFVSAILSDFIETPFSREWLSLVGKNMGPGSLAALTAEIVNRVEEEKRDAAAALSSI
jgi:hypothetical protein